MPEAAGLRDTAGGALKGAGAQGILPFKLFFVSYAHGAVGAGVHTEDGRRGVLLLRAGDKARRAHLQDTLRAVLARPDAVRFHRRHAEKYRRRQGSRNARDTLHRADGRAAI